MHATGVRLQHVPYKSAAEAVQAALSAQTSTMFDNPPSIMTQIKSGSLRATWRCHEGAHGAVARGAHVDGGRTPTTSKPHHGLDLVAPAKTPKPIVDKLAQETVKGA
jgi:hypothetical protein